MRHKKGFTLIELQISALMMVAVLVATGVIFYFALASVRYMHEAVTVYSNALSAMKIITKEVMVSNCFGSASAEPNYSGPMGGFYETDGYVQLGVGSSGLEALNAYDVMPNFGGDNSTVVTNGSMGSGLFLRQAVQSSTVLGVGNASIAGDFPSHEIVQIYRDVNPVDAAIFSLYIDRSSGGGPFKIADNVTRFDFTPLAYNSVHVELTVEGRLLDPIGGTARNSITLSKQITLRCAPSVTPIPDGTAW